MVNLYLPPPVFLAKLQRQKYISSAAAALAACCTIRSETSASPHYSISAPYSLSSCCKTKQQEIYTGHFTAEDSVYFLHLSLSLCSSWFLFVLFN